MESIQQHRVEKRIFEFPAKWDVTKYDDWAQYRQSGGISATFRAKGLDILAVDGGELWLIEMKDYAYYNANAPGNLADQVAMKVFHTLGALQPLARSSMSAPENDFALSALNCKVLRVVLHIEIRVGDIGQKAVLPSILQALRRRLRALEITDVRLSSVGAGIASPWTNYVDPSEAHHYLSPAP